MIAEVGKVTLEQAYNEAVAGQRQVTLLVKGARPMVAPRQKRDSWWSENWCNTFSFEELIVSVPQVCQLAGVDIRLVQDIDEHYRQHERWPRQNPDPRKARRLERQISRARRQLITNLFPFPKITWYRESSTGGGWEIGTNEKKRLGLSLQQIHSRCQPGKAVAKAIARHSRRMRKQKRGSV